MVLRGKTELNRLLGKRRHILEDNIKKVSITNRVG
jgi:hypothetical protein